MLVVADTSALIALAVCDPFDLLDAIAERVRVPQAVHREATAADKFGADVLEEYLQDKIVAVDLANYVIAAPGLGRGELEAMALYRKLAAHRLLMDDGRARKFARFNGMHVMGSLGVLVAAKRQGHAPSVRPYLQRLRRSSIYVAEELLEEALRLAGET